MKKPGRWLAFLAAVLMLTASACGQKPVPTETSKDTETEAVTEVTDTEETTTAEAVTTKEETSSPAEVITSDARVQDVIIEVENHGEEEQYAHFTFVFDSEVGTVLKEDMSFLHLGEEVDPELLSLECENNQVTVTYHLPALKAGKIDVDYSGEGVHPFTLNAIVSPGMHLETVSQDPEAATVTVRVCELYHVRGIGRVMLVENGETVMTNEETPSSFVGIHGHNFLEMDAEFIAEKIAYGLTENISGDYEFTNDGDTVTVKKLNAEGPVELMLTVQESAKLELK